MIRIRRKKAKKNKIRQIASMTITSRTKFRNQILLMKMWMSWTCQWIRATQDSCADSLPMLAVKMKKKIMKVQRFTTRKDTT